jgi:hypothetical protein
MQLGLFLFPEEGRRPVESGCRPDGATDDRTDTSTESKDRRTAIASSMARISVSLNLLVLPCGSAAIPE